MSTSTTSPTSAASEAPESEPGAERRAAQLLREIASSSALRILLSILLGFVAGAILLILSDPAVMQASTYFFSRPGDTIAAALSVVGRGYAALFQGAVYNFSASTPLAGFAPLGETLIRSAPLIAAGLGIALSFRVGLFNIGGQGQVIAGAAAAAWVGIHFPLPYGLHLLVALVVGVAASVLLGALVGYLKARTGAHEVIVTIMLNYIVLYFVTFLMRTPVLQDPSAGGTPKTPVLPDTVRLPGIGGTGLHLDLGIVLAIAAAIVYWWLMERSSLGFRFRTLGLNEHAARTAGINVGRTTVWAMALSALFVGVAGAIQALGRSTGFGPGIDSGIGFDAITVALLGGSNAGGVFAAGIFFGAMRAGSPAMQSVGVDSELLSIVQAMVVLFIAAPPLVRSIFRLPHPQRRSQKTSPVEPVESPEEAS